MQKTESKNEIAYRVIKEMIMLGQLTNETGISENMLVEKLNMSRTPIRAALQRLQLEEQIKIIPNQGIIISEMSMEEAKEKYDLRIAVELYVIKKVIDILSAQDFRNLHNILNQQKQACEKMNYYEFLSLDNEFHLYFLTVYKNKNIYEIITRFREKFFSIALRGIHKPHRMATAISEHEEILVALEERNLDKALACLENHIESGILRTIQSF